MSDAELIAWLRSLKGLGWSSEAADRIEELKGLSSHKTEMIRIYQDGLREANDRIEELEAKLAKAVKAFEEIKRYSPCGDSRRKAIDTLAELTGQEDK